MSDWREEYRDINSSAVGIAMAALYDTHVEENIGELRGEAVRAVARLAEALGRSGLIEEMERTPHSKRRRESPLWQELQEKA